MGTGCPPPPRASLGHAMALSTTAARRAPFSAVSGMEPGTGSRAAAGKPVPSGDPLTPLGPKFSEPSPCHSNAGGCRGAAPPRRPRHRHGAPMALGARRECSLQPCAGGVFMLCIPVRFEMSYWTSLGNFNILKRKIKKKEKEKTPSTFPQSRPRIPGALYGCTRCAPVAAAPLSLTSISPLVLPPALSSLCRDFRLFVRRWSRPGTRRGSVPGAPRQGGRGAGTAAPVRPCGG